MRSSHLFGFAIAGSVVSCVGSAFAAAAPAGAGTNFWVGAASGGSWADAANWRGVAKDGSEIAPLDLMKKSCYYVFTNLTDGAVITMDYAGGNDVRTDSYTKYALSPGFLFEIPKGATVKVVPGATCSEFMFNDNAAPKSVLTVNGGLLEWGAKQRTAIETTPWTSHLTVNGDGSVRFIDKSMLFWADWLYLSGTGNYYFPDNMQMHTSGLTGYGRARAIVEKNGGMHLGALSADGKTTLDVQEGAQLTLGTGFGMNGGSSTWKGYVEGAGTIFSCGGGLDAFARSIDSGDTGNLGFTGLFRWSQGGFLFGTAAAPLYLNAASALAADGGGFTHLYGNQTFATLSGIGNDGGLWAPTNGTVTLAGRADNVATSTVYSARITGSNTTLVKDGANYDLTLSGENDFDGAVRVKAGSLTLDRGGLRRKNLRAAWCFEDPDRIGADSSCGGQWHLTNDLACVSMSTIPLISLVDDGVRGKALHFDGSKLAYGTIFSDAPGVVKTGTLPSGNDPFTVSFWMRPNLSKCGSYPNFFRWWNESWSGLKGVSFRTINGSRFNRFAMCTDSGWTVSEPITPRYVAVANMTDSFGKADYLVDGKWHHIVGTYDAQQHFNLYVDAKLCATANLGANMNMPSGAQVRLGNYSQTDGNHKYGGDLDEVAIYYGCWSADDVKDEYEGGYKAAAQDILPNPVAHWTFDEETTEGDKRYFKDVSPQGNELDLESLPNGSGAYATTKPVVQPVANGGRYVSFPDASKGAYLKLRGDKSLGSVIGSGNVSFTLSVRLSRAMNGVTVLAMGNTNDTAKCVRLHHTSDCPRTIQFYVGSTGGKFDDQFQQTALEKYGADWSNLAVSYDAGCKVASLYRDGVLVKSVTSVSLNLDPVDFFVGTYRANLAALDTSFDDIRLYDVPLSAAQMKALARRVRNNSSDQPVLKTTVPVTVDAGAKLVLKGMGETFENTVTGSGTVEVAKGADCTVKGLSGFKGTLAVNGRATLDEIAVRLAQAAGGADVLSVGTDGLVTLADTGTIYVTDDGVVATDIPGHRWTLCDAAKIANPEAFENWTVSPSPSQGWSVKEKKGKLVLLAHGGLLILVR